MRVIYNDWLPFKGFKVINLFGILFARKGCKLSEEELNHEKIHSEQIKEMLYLPFYAWYVAEWIIRLFMDGNAYRSLLFEREAYTHQGDLKYLEKRKHFSWFRLGR